MPKSPDCPRCTNQLVIPNAQTLKEFTKQARQVWHSAHPKAHVGRPQVHPEMVRAIVKMLVEGTDISSIMKTLTVRKTTVERIRSDSHALALTIRDSERMADGDVREAEWRTAIKRAHGVRPEWRKAIIRGWYEAIPLNDIVDPIDPTHPFAPQRVDPLHDPVLLIRDRYK